jgi:hypothetical protein
VNGSGRFGRRLLELAVRGVLTRRQRGIVKEREKETCGHGGRKKIR